LFLQPVPTFVPPPPEQVTADALFEDTLDNAGILGFSAQAGLLFAAGEVDVGGTLDGADLYVAFATAGAPQVENVTLTSGVTSPPFQAGELEVRAGVLDPLGERLLLTVDPDGG